MTRILVVEDELPILTGICDNLEMEGYEVATAIDGEAALAMIAKFKPDLIVLDIMLPKIDGYEICRRLKESKSSAGILIVSAKKEDTDKVTGLDLGADDYVTKPFSVIEFLARIKALLRRRGQAPPLRKFSFADVKLNFEKFEAKKGKKKLPITPREFKILRLLVENRGRVVSRNEILNQIWGYDVFPTTRTVDNHIVKLRKSIEDNPAKPRHITSVRTIGYKFNG